MTDTLPNWLMKRYSILWKEFNEHPFTYEDAVKILKDKEDVLNVVLSNLKKFGWLSIKANEKDSRKRLYSLKNPIKAIEEIAMETKNS